MIGIQCKKCTSTKVQILSTEQKRSFLMTLIHIGLIFFTSGLWLVYLLLRGKDSKVLCVCCDCGSRWYL